MNIISQNCIGGWVYQKNNVEYNNPFIWTLMSLQSIFNLIKNYENIDFLKYNIVKTNLNTFYVQVDNQINIYYTHYIYNENCKEITKVHDKNGNHLMSCNAKEMVEETYLKRTKRMIEINESPNFIITPFVHCENNKNKINIFDIININSPYKRIIFTTDKKTISNNEFVKIIYLEKIIRPLLMVKQNLEKINEFFSI